jgi:hypothetical protein
MPFKLVIPASAILEQKDGILQLDHPDRCSRCGRTPAGFNENHRLKLRAGLKHNPLPGRRYKMERNYQLKLRVCERCYHMNYLQAPETLADDDNPLGQLARVQNFLRMLGGIIAGLGLLFLTPFIPATTALIPIKTHWWIPMSAGVGLVLLGLASQVWAQMKLRRQLESAGEFDPALERAEVRTPLYADPLDENQVALEVKIENESWSKECATFYHYHLEEFKE